MLHFRYPVLQLSGNLNPGSLLLVHRQFRQAAAMKLIAFAVLAQFITLTTAFTIRGSIPPTQLLPNPATLSADTQITLTTSGARKSALLRTDNTFVFRNISEGSYILDTSCPTYHFAPLRVDVSRSGDVTVHQTFRGNPWSNLGEARGHPIVRFFCPFLPYFVEMKC